MSEDLYRTLEGNALGGYIIDRFLAIGGQAVVYEAHAQGLDKRMRYALKIFGLMNEDAAGVKQGFSEARKLSMVEHAHVVKVSLPIVEEVAFDGGLRQVLCLPMDYSALGDCDSAPRFRDEALGELELRNFIGLLDGLGVIHAADIIHNDLKPGNILQFEERRDVAREIVLKISDFGIAMVLSEMGMRSAESSGLTLPFMAPERLDQEGTNQTDIYAMGCTLFAMVTGTIPIEPASDERRDIRAWQRAHRELPRPLATDRNPMCPPRLAILLTRMMAVDPGERPSIEICMDQLRSCISDSRSKATQHELPAQLAAVLKAERFPILYQPPFIGVFKPAVHEICGQRYFVARARMNRASLSQYRRLVEYLIHRHSDTFCLYEVWGSADIMLLLWSTLDRMAAFEREFHERFVGGELYVGKASRIFPLEGSDEIPETVNRVWPLAIQDEDDWGSWLSKSCSKSDYLGDKFPAEPPEHSVRGFTFVESIRHKVDGSTRQGLLLQIREELLKLVKRDRPRGKDREIKRMRLIELEEADWTDGLMLVDFVVSEYKHLARIPTTIIGISESALKTSTYLETGRLVIQSDRILH